jgi:hypothetical protein
MSASQLTPLTESANWQELRDERGRLYARLDERRLLLEVSYHRERVTFDLRDYLEVLRGLEIGADIE